MMLQKLFVFEYCFLPPLLLVTQVLLLFITILKSIVSFFRLQTFIMVVNVLYKSFEDEEVEQFAILFLSCRRCRVTKFNVMLVLIKLFVPFIFKFLSGHEMTIDDTHIFSVNWTISLSLHAFIYFGEIPLFALLLSYFLR